MTEITTTDAQATHVQAEAPEATPSNPDRVWFRNDYARAVRFIRTSRQARYGAPWDAKDNPMAQPTIDALAAQMAEAFMADNPAFNPETWLEATQLPAKPELPEGAIDAEEAGDPDDLAAILDDDTE